MIVNRNSKRNLILSAASLIVNKQGVEKLTLEAVAKEAGISKGGLLHHFPNKEALLKAMVEELTNGFVADVQNRANADTIEKGKWSRAYLQSTLGDLKEETSTALTTSFFTNKDLLGELQNQYSIWQKNLENDGIDPVDASIIRLVADGLWFSELFGIGKIDDELREKIIHKLQLMTK
ncbi:TetR/AcrR family transcriptional regulator [Paenibacillus sp. Marseille-Q4541]|uniref:TetR/AcrR family transcriptional regulator n=1 Tax=Paenibacillus sp. Marseille-Q4541 TaxID=2831522 RepID=UPI001BAC1F8E|nr:TetR/AcrR family transcriptional regulator [Paenibacillus sp. Marseille-Q4541]